MKKTTVVSGVACMLGTLLLAGGCKSQVMADRGYVPVAEESSSQYTEFSETSVESTPAGTVEETMTEEIVKAPAAPVAPAAPAAVTYPSFESFAGKVPSGPSTVASKGGKYVVKKGDTVSHIALANGVSVSALLSANGLTLDSARKIRVGQTLVIPAAGSKAVAVTKNGKAVKKSNGAKKSTPAAKSAGKSAVAESASGYYVVKSGDNIPKIARQLKVKTSELMAANSLDEAATRRLRVGQKLVIPGKGAAPVASSAVSTASYGQTSSTATGDKATDAALDAVDNALDSVPATSAPATAAPATSAPAVTTPATTAPAGAAAVPANEEFIGGSTPIEVKDAAKLEDFAKANGITVETFKKLNGDIVLTDGMIPAGSIVFIPTK